jgi:hypothetical protein
MRPIISTTFSQGTRGGRWSGREEEKPLDKKIAAHDLKTQNSRNRTK